jgi:hypothetical protein
MRPRIPLAIATILALIGVLALGGAVLAHQATLTASLEGSAETDEDGTGTATIMLDSDAGTACWEITTENIPPATQSHIHEGAAGVDGGVVVPLDVDGFDGSTEGCVADQDNTVLQGIIDNPTGFYVNVHTEEFPGGAIRGQLAGAAAPSTAMDASAPSALVALGAILLLAAVVLGLRSLRADERLI